MILSALVVNAGKASVYILRMLKGFTPPGLDGGGAK